MFQAAVGDWARALAMSPSPLDPLLARLCLGQLGLGQNSTAQTPSIVLYYLLRPTKDVIMGYVSVKLTQV
jgi:hypothetical protein